jgi:hypothetical protein
VTARILYWLVAGLFLPLTLPWAVASSASAPAIIPLPQKIEGRAGEFKLLPATRILADASSTGTGDYLAERLRKSTGYPLKVEALTSARISASNWIQPPCVLPCPRKPTRGPRVVTKFLRWVAKMLSREKFTASI